MVLEESKFGPEEKQIATLAAMIETGCAPIFSDIRKLYGVDITSEKIIKFAEFHKVRNESVELATHICEVLLGTILKDQNGSTYIHTTQCIREEVERIMDRNAVHLESIKRTYKEYDLPLNLRRDLLTLAQQFLEEV